LTQDSGASVVLAASVDSTSPSKKTLKPSATSNGTGTARKSLKHECKIKTSTMPLSGLIYVPSMVKNGLEGWILSLEDSHAKIFQSREKERESKKGQEAGYSSNYSDLFVKYDPVTSSWRTCQQSLGGDSIPFSDAFMKRGMMRNGRLWRPLRSELCIGGNGGFVLLGTMTATNRIRSPRFHKGRRLQPQELVMILPTLSAQSEMGGGLETIISGRESKKNGKN